MTHSFNGDIEILHASAGTGKTHALIEKVEEAVKQGVAPQRVAFVSFTKAAAEVARDRAAAALNISRTQLPNFRTIHSTAFRGTQANRQQMMTEERYTEFGNAIGMRLHNVMVSSTEGLDWDDIQDRNIVSLEQLYRNNRGAYERITEDRVDNARLVNYMRFYKQFKEQHGYTDFTDLLERYIADEHTEDVDVVCLDEMQDSSLLQWQLVMQAFSNASKIYIAGDDKQAVYKFQGAESDMLLKLRGKQHVLDLSYRVPSKIMDFANNIAKLIDTPYNAPCRTTKEGGVVDYINNVDELDIDFDFNKTYFFLSRGQAARKYFTDYCEKRGINYIKDGVPRLTEQDYFEFTNNRAQTWDIDKQLFAAACIQSGTWPGVPKVRIGTIHSTKGDEADRVVVLSDIPRLVHKSMSTIEGEDNEHRVFYVACTRAKEKLYIVLPQSRFYYSYIL